jgi:hypothetical protein
MFRSYDHLQVENILFATITQLILNIYLFITNCNWAYARWQCYVNNEQYVSSTECTECKNINT